MVEDIDVGDLVVLEMKYHGYEDYLNVYARRNNIKPYVAEVLHNENESFRCRPYKKKSWLIVDGQKEEIANLEPIFTVDKDKVAGKVVSQTEAIERLKKGLVIERIKYDRYWVIPMNRDSFKMYSDFFFRGIFERPEDRIHENPEYISFDREQINLRSEAEEEYYNKKCGSIDSLDDLNGMDVDDYEDYLGES